MYEVAFYLERRKTDRRSTPSKAKQSCQVTHQQVRDGEVHEHSVDPGAGRAAPPEYDEQNGDVAYGREHKQDGVDNDGDHVTCVEAHVDGQLVLSGDITPVREQAEGARNVVERLPHRSTQTLPSHASRIQPVENRHIIYCHQSEFVMSFEIINDIMIGRLQLSNDCVLE